jgi:hypothetical protein
VSRNTGRGLPFKLCRAVWSIQRAAWKSSHFCSYEFATCAVTWSGIAYLHASEVRFRANGGEWGDWQSVHTRNFSNLNQRSVDHMPRWKCLVGSEIAWASVKLRDGHWDVEPLAISVYEKPELERLRPLPTRAQIDAKEAIEPMHLQADDNARQGNRL